MSTLRVVEGLTQSEVAGLTMIVVAGRTQI